MVMAVTSASKFIGFRQACETLGISMTQGYKLIGRGEFPTRVIRIGGVWKVPRHELESLVGCSLDV
jgi:predicted DNA-binding transcriptional regulator AlpA